MTRNEALVACGVWVASLGAGAVEAGTQDSAVIALHGHAITTKRITCSTGKPTGVLCTGYNLNLPTFTECFVYLTVARADSAAGVTGMSLGIDYTQGSLGMWGWIQCLSGLAFSTPGPNGDWPNAGSGATITWLACNRDVVPGGGVHAIVGSFDIYAYADDVLRITDNNNLLIDKELRVADCTPTESILKPGAGGSVGFGAQTGTNPCLCAPCVELQVPDTTIVHGLPSNLVPVTVTNCSVEDADLTVNSWIGGQAAPPEVFSAVPPAGVRTFDLSVPCDGDVVVVCEAVATLVSDSGCSIADTVSATVSCLGLPITGIEDVGNDQGRVVRLSFARSNRDGPGSPTPVLQYEAYRRIDPLPAAAAGLNVAAIGSAAGTDPRARRPLSDQGVQLAGWDFVDAFPAHRESDYSVLVPTLADSTISDGMHWSVFFVRAATADPYTFFDSSPDSGYSLDNLSPAAPMGLLLSPSAMLSWDESAAPDFDFFTVYGSDAETMGPGAVEIGTTTGTDFDVSANPHPFYLVAATDFSGNEGPVRSQASVATTAAGTGI
jgi:hypothetical protein